jgi:hypothetical protein
LLITNSIGVRRYLDGYSVQFDSVEMLAFRPRTRAKSRFRSLSGNRVHGILSAPHLAKN